MYKKLINFFDIKIIIFFVALYAYLISYFPFGLLFSDTIITGGDTASHFSAVYYLKKRILENAEVISWFPGNYGGFPLFIYYFPPLYILAILLSIFYPLTISFKIITLIGTLLLPISSYLMIKLFRFSYPAPLFAAAASLLFLFNSSNSMWGGNIYSTLAGEFSYSAGFSLTFLFFGLLFDLSEKIKTNPDKFCLSEIVISSLVFSLVGLSHGFTLLICLICSTFFLLSAQYLRKNILSLLLIFLIGSLLFSWWFIPLLLNLPYTTQFEFSWNFTKLHELMPVIFIPGFISFILFSLFVLLTRTRFITSAQFRATKFIWYVILISVLAFYYADKFHVPDIRFLPFVQYLITILGFSVFGLVVSKICSNNSKLIHFSSWAALVFVYGLIIFDFATNPNHWLPSDWIKWNYQGYQNAPDWQTFNQINNFLKGSFSDPRVVSEHSDNTNKMGSTRAFENLPLFAKRATLEGVYFQSSLLSPFVFYLQSLYSAQKSCPFPNYPCSSTNLERAHDYLKLMNVSQLILQSEVSKNQTRALPELYEKQLEIKDSPYEIWKLKSKTEYIEVLRDEPEFTSPDNFRNKFYYWFTDYHSEKKFIYTIPKANSIFYTSNTVLPRSDKTLNLYDNKACEIKELIEDHVISFTTTCPGKPHLIKISYNPAWHVDGADGPYLISPAFMLVYPRTELVSLEYKPYIPKLIGQIFTIIGLILTIIMSIGIFHAPVSRTIAKVMRY